MIQNVKSEMIQKILSTPLGAFSTSDLPVLNYLTRTEFFDVPTETLVRLSEKADKFTQAE